MVSVDGTKIDANASKRKSIRYDRIQQLGRKLAEDIVALTAQAEAADAAREDDGLSLPEQIARRETLKSKLDAAAWRLEEAALKDHGGDDPPPAPSASKQTNLTDPDIQTSLREWAYARSYNTSDQRGADLPAWTHMYNWHRPLSALHSKPPITALGLDQHNLLRLHSVQSSVGSTQRALAIKGSCDAGWSLTTAD
jgi:hypothetical protein